DVLAVVVVLDRLQGHARVLVDQPAAVAGDEAEVARLAGEVILGGEEVGAGVAAAAVARNVFEHRGGRRCGGGGAGHDRAPRRATFRSQAAPASSAAPSSARAARDVGAARRPGSWSTS